MGFGRLSLAGFAALALAVAPGCFVTSSDEHPASGGSGGSGGNGGSSPIGPVAHDATEAWPDRPSNVPVLGPEDIVRGCVELISCNPPVGSGGTPTFGMDFCISQVEWSAERAIPMSNLMNYNERAEFVVTCLLAHVGDCNAQKQCWTGRDSAIYCEEDGCKALAKLSVTCDGAIAHIKKNDSSFDRDCSRAYADCDAASPTGCTDRHFSVCPADGNHADHCDGDVRLGCDGSGQVSYHDCSRMGGTCGTSGTSQDCVYTTPPDSGCTSPDVPGSSCQNGTLSACVKGKRVSVSAPGICPAA